VCLESTPEAAIESLLVKILVKTDAYFLPIVANYCRLLP